MAAWSPVGVALHARDEARVRGALQHPACARLVHRGDRYLDRAARTDALISIGRRAEGPDLCADAARAIRHYVQAEMCARRHGQRRGRDGRP